MGCTIYQPYSPLHQLCVKSKIQREKLHGIFVYFSINGLLYKSQFNKHTILQTQYIEDEISCIVAVSLLIEKIRRPNEDLSHLFRVLHKEKIKISELQAKSLLITNIYKELCVFVNCIIPFTMKFMS